MCAKSSIAPSIPRRSWPAGSWPSAWISLAIDIWPILAVAQVGALAEAWPDLAITIVDLPATKPVAERHLAEAGLSKRIAVQGADVVAGAISGIFDVAIMRGLSLILTLDQLRKAFGTAYRALMPGAPLYVVGWILDDSRLSPPNYVADNLRLASQYDEAQLHTEADHRALLSEAGFKDITRDPVASVYGSDFIVGFKR